LKRIEAELLNPTGFKYMVLDEYRSNTSTKPHARLMHSLAVIAFGEIERDHHKLSRLMLHSAVYDKPNPNWVTPPNRTARRLTLQPVQFPNCAHRRAMTRAAKFGKPTPIFQPVPVVTPHAQRRLTGAVRRGLQRGRVA
jgi:hypothetical protein